MQTEMLARRHGCRARRPSCPCAGLRGTCGRRRARVEPAHRAPPGPDSLPPVHASSPDIEDAPCLSAHISADGCDRCACMHGGVVASRPLPQHCRVRLQSGHNPSCVRNPLSVQWAYTDWSPHCVQCNPGDIPSFTPHSMRTLHGCTTADNNFFCFCKCGLSIVQHWNNEHLKLPCLLVDCLLPIQ